MIISRLTRLACIAGLLASVLVLGMPSPAADAQSTTCSAATEAELAGCITAFNASAGDPTTIEITADIALTALLPTIDNPTDTRLWISGNGHVLDGTGFFVVIAQVDGFVTTIVDLTVTGAFAGVSNAGDGTILVRQSTFTGLVIGMVAGSSGQTQAINSTFHGLTDGSSTAFYMGSTSGTSRVTQSTITGNGQAFGADAGAGPLVVTDSLLATNESICGTNVAFTAVTSTGNVYGDDSCSGSLTFGLDGTFDSRLRDNGCTTPCTQTIALFGGSPAVDSGANCANPRDQRGVDRTPNRCDSGSFEAGDCYDNSNTFTVSTSEELGFAVGCFNLVDRNFGSVTIEFASDITLDRNLPIMDNWPARMTISGNGYELVASDGSTFRNAIVQRGAQSTISALTIRDAFTGFFNSGGTMLIQDSAVVGGITPSIDVRSSTTLLRSTVQGPAIQINGPLVVDGSTIVGTANALIAFGSDAEVTMVGSIVASNTAVACRDDGTPIAFTDLGGNVFSDNSCTGESASGLLVSIADTAESNGCTEPCTPTLALLPGSPAVDANSNCGSGLVDQRGVARTGGACDAGAFELGDVDADGDGFEGVLGDGADCDDTNPAVKPGGTEVAYNGLDDDCVGGDLVDVDGDGFAASASTGSAPDCDDTNPAVRPGGIEVAYNGLDDDCVGGDLNDVDGDGSTASVPTGSSPDCDDTNPAIGPGAAEIADNGIDEDCDGADLVEVTCSGKLVTINMNTNGGSGAGTAGDDVILGTGGNDVITGSGGNDTICGGAGDDRITGGAGDDKLFGRSGDDTIFGGPGNDVIHGNKGDDTLRGEDGEDRIFGYADNDNIAGGNGDDRLHGNFGNDVINGDAGNDSIFGYGDEDTLNGGDGNDLISGNFGDDVINGNAGNDRLFGADGDDRVSGGVGNDRVNGNSLNDILSGGPGDDTLDGGINNDTCDGGPGVDTSTRCETNLGIP